MFIEIFLLLISIVKASERPNFLIFFIEDIDQLTNLLKPKEKDGYSKSLIPNIQTLLKDSVEFKNMYSEVSSTSTFASILTGKPAVDTGLIRGKLLPFDYFPSLASSGGLKESEITLAEKLSANTYKTWFSGYWKLGLGAAGDGFPTKHGFNTWLGIAHPNSEWCHRKKTNKFTLLTQTFNPYVNLLYNTTFLWALIISFLAAAVWLKIIELHLFINLLVYTFATSVLFYVLLYLFIMQRSASCVLFYHDKVYQQPYEMDNLTLHFNQHTSRLIDIVSNIYPFFAVVNYIKLKSPLFHSHKIQENSADVWTGAVIELDWSIGKIMQKLKEHNVYNNTLVIFTGNNNCIDYHSGDKNMYGFERRGKNDFKKIRLSQRIAWRCLRVPFYLKATSQHPTTTVHEIAEVTDVYDTILDAANLLPIGHQSSSLLLMLNKKKCPVLFTKKELISNVLKSSSNNLSCSYVKTISFGYCNIHKPAVVTFRGRFQIVYSYLEERTLKILKQPIVLDLLQVMDISDIAILEKTYQDVSERITSHILDRQNKNPWSSEFEMPVYPWLLPCSNFPYCELFNNGDSIDFADILEH